MKHLEKEYLMVMLEKMKLMERQSLVEVALDEQQPLEAMIEAKKQNRIYTILWFIFIYC
jgi:hypothetical protein